MTNELTKITPKELKELQKGLEIIKKVYGLDDESIDVFFRIVRNSQEITKNVERLTKRVESLERTVAHETNANDAEQAKRLYKAMNTPLEAFKL